MAARVSACRLGFRVCALLLLLLSPSSFLLSSLHAEVTKEYQVKAAFLYNFTKFVDWPHDSFASPTDPIVIAVLGRNPFDGELENVVHGRTVAGRPIVLATIDPGAIPSGGFPKFHVLFVAAGEETSLRRLGEALPTRGVLTVGETERFAELGGIITFVVINERVHFGINRESAAAAGVTISAQLQKLATPAARIAGAKRP